MEGLKIHNIYVITNKITNKKYVGETSLDIQERFNSHKKSAKYRQTYELC